jgi:ribulose-phosphate 3-epimerase
MENMMPKVALLRREIDRLGLDIDLEVDGGVAPKTAEVCVQNGANVLVAGSAIFKAEDAAKVIEDMKEVAKRYF